MRRMIAAAGATALMGALIAVGVPATVGASSSTECAGPLAPGTYRAVVVPDGAFCFGDGPVTIRGGLSIGAGATFQLGSDEGSAATGSIGGGRRATHAAAV